VVNLGGYDPTIKALFYLFSVWIMRKAQSRWYRRAPMAPYRSGPEGESRPGWASGLQTAAATPVNAQHVSIECVRSMLISCRPLPTENRPPGKTIGTTEF